MKKNIVVMTCGCLLLLSGCGFKSTAITFPTPASIYMGDKAYARITLNDIIDSRSDTHTVGYVRNSEGSIENTLITSSDMHAWMRETFEKEVRAAGFAPVTKSQDADMNVTLTVKQIEADYTQSQLTDKNLRLRMEIEATIIKHGVTVTKKYRYDESRWIKPTFESDGLRDALVDFTRESIVSIVKDLVALSQQH